MGRKHEDKYVQLGLNISYYRKKKKMTQEQLAELIDVSRTHISNIEATKMDKSLSLDVLFDIADALEVKVEALFELR
jgi:DNA-binding XRE family transcriptional regulator